MNLSVKENVIKEIKEEAGIDITVERLIAIHDSNKHYKGMYPYGITKGSKEQVEMCFKAYYNPNWQAEFE